MEISNIKKYSTTLVIFILTFSVFLGIAFSYIQNKSEMECSKMEQLLLAKSTKVGSVLTNMLYKTHIIAALVVQNNGATEGLERVMPTILDDPSIRNFIIAPNGVVEGVYPLESNKEVIGLNYFSEGAGNKEAIIAKEKGALVLGGPFEVVQGGKQAIVGRLPVYFPGKKFWGIVSVTLNYPDALESAELSALESQGFAYEIWRSNPDNGERQIIANSNYDYNKKALYIEMPLRILNAEWYFRLSPIRLWYQHPETWILISLGLVISFLLATLTAHNKELKKIKNELESISNRDELTGVFNRRGILGYLENLVGEPQNSFALAYIDVNKFKNVNDQFGHLVGDRLLQQLVKVFGLYMNDKQTLGRVGGDEFILISEGETAVSDLVELFEIVREKLQHTLPIERSHYIDISICVGTAVYPEDASNIDALVKCADIRMYENKCKN